MSNAELLATTEDVSADFCVIGAGSGGLSVAAAAAAFGEKVVLIEKGRMGGDCLNYGCVPSKALIAAGRRADAMRTAEPFGIANVDPLIKFEKVNEHVKNVIAAIEPNDSVERFTGLGVQVIKAAARFKDRETVIAGEHKIKARYFVIATGSSPFVPPIPGIDTVSYFTNETIFDNQKKIEHLIIVGGGPIGMEMAQAHHRLGSRVTIIEAASALSKDDPELTAIALKHLRGEGIEIREHTTVEQVEGDMERVRVKVKFGDRTDAVEGSHLLVATGRKANVSGLGLEDAGVKYDKHGIKVNSALKTSNRRIYAIGDVTGGYQFTHVANYHAGIVIQRTLFWLPSKPSSDGIPWVTYIEPELANVGLTESQAAKKNKKIKVLRWPYHENDRAQASRTTSGLVKVITDNSGTILGAGIVGAHAGELIQMWSLAISQKMKIKAMTGWISPYPTLAEINKRVAYKYYASAPASPIVRKVIGLLKKFG